MASPASAETIPLLTLEEHFTSHAATAAGLHNPDFPGATRAKLRSLAEQRLGDMAAGGVTRQVISHTPFRSPPSASLCRAINDELAAAVAAHADRFSGFASLPMLDPPAAAAELKWAVEELGFVGALVDNHAAGTWYDGREYDVLWEQAVALDVPIYLHPSFATEGMMDVNYRSPAYDEKVAGMLAGPVFGWHVEAGLHFLRLFSAGVFDRHPRLKLILGHMGELIPYMLARQERITGAWDLQRPLGTVWRENVWVTTSGMFDTASLRCLLAQSPLDHVLFSVDYPFSDNETGRRFVESVEREGVLMGEELVGFGRGWAERLLGIGGGA